MLGNKKVSKWMREQRIDTLTPADRTLGQQVPDPNGWFGLAFSDQVKPGTVYTSQFMGKDIVLYRTRAGTLRAVNPYCPHMGAHLGLGKVEGEKLVCAYHAFSYGLDGSCVKTEYGGRVPRLDLTPLTIAETASGLIVVWHHGEREAPSWEAPEGPTEGYAPWVHTTIDTVGHPQDLPENAIDFGHFGPYHGMAGTFDPSVVFADEGFKLKLLFQPLATLEFKPFGLVRMRPPRRLTQLTFMVKISTHGLGVFFGEFMLPNGRPLVLTCAMPSVQSPGRVRIRLGASLVLPRPWPWPLRKVQHAMLRIGSRVALRLILGFGFNEDQPQSDMTIWATRMFIAHPQKVEGDGPITEFRRWAKQFYPAPESNGQAVRATQKNPRPASSEAATSSDIHADDTGPTASHAEAGRRAGPAA